MLTIFLSASCQHRPQLTGADTLLPAKMEGAVAKRMLPSSVIVLMVGLDAIVTSLESPVKQLLAREVFLYPLHHDI